MIAPASPQPMPVEPPKQPALASAPAIVLYIATATLLLHFVTANRYGYFGDEMYHLACAEHLDWGYVDQPPLIAVLAWVTRHTFGTSLFAIRLLPALAGFVLIWLTGVITRELGGGRFAQSFAALCVALGGIYLVMDHLFTMNAFEPLIWMGCAYLVIRILRTDNQKLWLWFGVLAGVGLENKYSMATFGFGIVAGLLLTRQRKVFAGKWIWMGGALAFLIFLPNLIWNIQHHFPFVELMRNIRASGRDVQMSPPAFIMSQILLMTPATFPVWLLGVLYFFFWPDGKRFRVLGWAFLTVLAMFMALHGKDYYATPLYPMVLAGGAVAIEQLSARNRLAWLKSAIVTLLLGVAIWLLPIAVPVLSPQQFASYLARLPFKLQPEEKSHTAEPLPHHYSWCFGWEDMVAGVSRVYNTLPPEQRADTAIFGNNFGEAGAIDLLGARYGLPKAISGHQSYWLWGPRNYSGDSAILVGVTPQRARQIFRDVSVGAELHNPYASPWENQPVLLCRGRKQPWDWSRLKNWD